MSHTDKVAELEEKLRRCNEQRLELSLKHCNSEAKLEQYVTSLRWWAVAYLIWMLREVIEPARYALSYPASWAYKLAEQTAHPMLLFFWFMVAFLMVLPLVFFLIFNPDHPKRILAEGHAMRGLAMGGVGYAFLATSAMRLDIPHVVDSYVGSTLMLITTALLVACWHNARVVQACTTHELPKEDSTCAEMVA